jgi:hypothetical protein
MIPRRIAEHVKSHDWFAVAIDFVIVVVGVLVATQVDNWYEASEKNRRTAQLIEGLRQDLRDAIGAQEGFIAEVGSGLAAFDAARTRGDRPLPYYFRTPGSDTPPTYVWQSALQSGIADLIHPSLLFDLGFYYSEQDGIGLKYVRYAIFVEDDILPRLNEGSSAFYDDDGKLKPAFAANVDRLREWLSFVQVGLVSAKCLDERFANPAEAGKSCRPTYPDPNAGSKGTEHAP